MKALFFKISLMTAVLITADMAAYSQAKKQELPAEVQYLMKFVGRWESQATLTADGKTQRVVYWINCRKTAGGSGIYMDEGFRSTETGTMSGADLAGFDPYDSKIKWFSIDNMGTTHEYIGEWQSPDHLFMEYTGTRDGKKYAERIDFTFKTPDVLEFKMVGTLDDVETDRGDGIYYKKPPDVK
jgi:hypothetical protein